MGRVPKVLFRYLSTLAESTMNRDKIIALLTEAEARLRGETPPRLDGISAAEASLKEATHVMADEPLPSAPAPPCNDDNEGR